MLIWAGLGLIVGGLVWGFTPVAEQGPCGSLFVPYGNSERAVESPGSYPANVSPTCAATREGERMVIAPVLIAGLSLLAAGVAESGHIRQNP